MTPICQFLHWNSKPKGISCCANRKIAKKMFFLKKKSNETKLCSLTTAGQIIKRRKKTFLTRMTAVGQISVYNHDYNLHISPRQLTMKAHTQLWDAAMHRGPGSIGGSVQI